MKTTGAILALLAAITSSGVKGAEARSYGGSVLAPRRYQYNRSPDNFGLISDIFTMPLYMNSLMRQHQREVERLTESASPRYEVTEDAETGIIELYMELPGVLAKDLNVEVEDGKLLRISGTRKHVRHGSIYESKFDQSFQMNDAVDTERIQVTLSAGILRIQAPKKEKTIKRLQVLSVEENHDPVLQLNPNHNGHHERQMEAIDVKAETTQEEDGLTISED